VERYYLSSRIILEIRSYIYRSKESNLNVRRFLVTVKENKVSVSSAEWMSSVLSKDSHPFKIVHDPICIIYNSASKYNTIHFD